jgi:L-aspartate oxidase
MPPETLPPWAERVSYLVIMAREFDVLVVGSGIAGLSLALKVAARGHRVAILTKKTSAESNTNRAQGGIAVVMSRTDDFESHVRDTLVAGDGLCRERVVRTIVREGPARVRELIELGLKFSRDRKGNFELGREGGHSHRRILHVKDMTGRAIEEALLQAVAADPRITLLEHFFAIDVVTVAKLARAGPPRTRQARPAVPAGRPDDRVIGLYALDVQTGRVETFAAPVVMLATGGAGQVYLYTTNPDIATGDGIAMAYRAGVEIRNLEFIQFHPTTLYSTSNTRFLISEAVRGEGAILRNHRGEAFMRGCHPLADLAPRDIVARAIDQEMKRSGMPHVWLDITHRSEAFLRERFPQIFTTCRQFGINMARDMIPVVPAAHYTCGGVATNLDTETALPGLYACGEVSCTGLHGANRLASNSLLEAVVLAHRGADAIERYLRAGPRKRIRIPPWIDLGGGTEDERVVVSHNWEELRRAMWDYVGIVRTTKRLERARSRIANLAKEIHDYYWNFSVEPRLLELRDMVQVAELIVACALQRHESRGLHAIIDFPRKLKAARDTVVRKA